MIKLVRIDDRLVHGQVAFTWVPAVGADCLIVANDKAATDEFLKMTLGLAKPPNTKLVIKSLRDTATILNDEKYRNLKILVLVNSVDDAHKLSGSVSTITSINFGGIRAREGSRLISKAIAITESDIILIKQMLDRGIELEVRQVPTDTRQLMQSLI
jgi:fructoselysine and glucoselysine-specific PTS system IIB component